MVGDAPRRRRIEKWEEQVSNKHGWRESSRERIVKYSILVLRLVGGLINGEERDGKLNPFFL